jgi:hypothetical protein
VDLGVAGSSPVSHPSQKPQEFSTEVRVLGFFHAPAEAPLRMPVPATNSRPPLQRDALAASVARARFATPRGKQDLRAAIRRMEFTAAQPPQELLHPFQVKRIAIDRGPQRKNLRVG